MEESKEYIEYIEYKECPACAEDVKFRAKICRYCGAAIPEGDKTKGGKFISIRLKASDKIFTGDIYVTFLKCRVSDIVNDDRRFLSIVNTVEETKNNDKNIGYVAFNKSVVEWISEVKKPTETKAKPFYSHTIMNKPEDEWGRCLIWLW